MVSSIVIGQDRRLVQNLDSVTQKGLSFKVLPAVRREQVMEIQSERLISQAATAIGGNRRQVNIPPSGVRRYLMKKQIDLEGRRAVLRALNNVWSQSRYCDRAKGGARKDVVEYLVQDGGASSDGESSAHTDFPSRRRKYSSSEGVLRRDLCSAWVAGAIGSATTSMRPICI